MNSENNSGESGNFNPERKFQPINTFNFDGVEQPVSFVETMQVKDGVECDVYSFTQDKTKDLGIIRVASSNMTPLQRVLQGEKTIEQSISGKGKLTVTKQDGTQEILTTDESNKISKIVNIGETMRWEADTDSELVVAEICYPPYQEGRFENID